MTFISCNALGTNPLKGVSMNNQECKIRTKIIDTNSNEPSFYPFSISVRKCSGSCNNIEIHMQNYVFLTLQKTCM